MIADSYKTLPIGKYVEVLAACEDIPDKLDRQVRIVSILSGMTEAEVLNLPIVKYQQHVDSIEFLTREDTGHHRIADVYHLGAFDLVPARDMQRITAAQYIDFQSIDKDRNRNIVQLLSCFLVPKGMTYGNGYDIAEVQAAIRDNLCTSDALALLAFFLSRQLESITSILISSAGPILLIKDKTQRRTLMKQYRQALKALRRSGAGLRSWMR